MSMENLRDVILSDEYLDFILLTMMGSNKILVNMEFSFLTAIWL